MSHVKWLQVLHSVPSVRGLCHLTVVTQWSGTDTCSSSQGPYLGSIPSNCWLFTFPPTTKTSNKKFSYRKQAHVGMEPNQTGTTPQYAHTIPTSCAVLLTLPTTKLCVRWRIDTQYITHTLHLLTQHSAVVRVEDNAHIPCWTETCKAHNVIDTEVAHNKHKAYLYKWRHDGTRCRDGVKVLWCHFRLVWIVFEASIPTCTCFPSENFSWLCRVGMLLFLDVRAHIACILGFLAKCKLLIRRLAIDFGHFMVVGKIFICNIILW